MAENDIADYDMGGEPEVTQGLAIQTFADLDLDTLSPLLPQVMSRQATINIGTIGHVAHGKSTVVKAISDVRTMQYHKEAVMNLTIHLGYANAKIFKCPQCKAPDCYAAYGSRQADQCKCKHCNSDMTLQRHVSFVDCPGHDILMATMLNGAAIMDAALLLVAANEQFPQPQTLEHLKAVEIMRLQSVIVLQNKIDLVKRKSDAVCQHTIMKSYLKNTQLRDAPIIPISAQLKYNIDLVLEYLCHVPVPRRRFDLPLRMIVVRSFDVNKPGEDVAKLTGGVAGGSVLEGVLRLGQQIEVWPGLRTRSSVDGNVVFKCRPITAMVRSLSSENNSLLYAVPGGLIGVGTNIDPALTRQNKLVGNLIVGSGVAVAPPAGAVPTACIDLELALFAFCVGTDVMSTLPAAGDRSRAVNRGAPSSTAAASRRRNVCSPSTPATSSVPILAAGVGSGVPESPATPHSSYSTRVDRVRVGEILQLNIRAATVAATVKVSRGPLARLELHAPVVGCDLGTRVTLCRRMGSHFRLIGWGSVRKVIPCEIEPGR